MKIPNYIAYLSLCTYIRMSLCTGLCMHAYILHTCVQLIALFPQDMGTFVIGKLEAGTLVKGQSLVMMPNKVCSQRISVQCPVRFPPVPAIGVGTRGASKLPSYTHASSVPHTVPLSLQVQVEVLSVCRNEQEIQKGFCGDNLKIKLKGIEEEEISSGFVLCPPDNYCHVGKIFDAQVRSQMSMNSTTLL